MLESIRETTLVDWAILALLFFTILAAHFLQETP